MDDLITDEQIDAAWSFSTGGSIVTEDMRAFARKVALEAVRRERERVALPPSYGGSTLCTWGDQKEGGTLRLHFTDAKEAEAWFERLTDQWDRSRSQETSR